jgi:hypothetical protein
MLRLNLDEMTPQTDPARLLGPSSSNWISNKKNKAVVISDYRPIKPTQIKCGLLIFLGGSPKPLQDVNQQHRYYCSSTASQASTPFPQKEPAACFL